jgi:hypothetical protein
VQENVSGVCVLPVFCVSQGACQRTSYPDVAVLAERKPEVVRQVGRLGPQNGGEATKYPAALREQADAVTKFQIGRVGVPWWLGNGHHEAGALLGYSDPGHVSPEAAEAAAQRLSEPTTNGPSGFGTGTGAVNDSLLAAALPVEQRIPCIEMLWVNAASPWEPSSNRDSYLIAASNLTDDLDDEHRTQFLDAAMNFAASPPPSQADAFNASMSNPLGAMRIHDRSDSRPAATFLAGRLAESAVEKRLVRDAALRLVGVGSDDDYRSAKLFLTSNIIR